MKIGIISMQRVPNYGSFLQALGLKSILEKMGHQVIFIDYKVGLPAVEYSKKAILSYKFKSIRAVAWLHDWFKYNVQGNKNFVYSYKLKYLKVLGVTYKRNYNEKVDLAIIGSDEVFNCLQKGANVGFSPMLFGCGINTKKVISYAASFGYTDYDGLEKYGVKEKVQGYLKNLSKISVRDQHSCEMIKRITGKEPELNLDPVLIADYKLPNKKLKYRNYIILYTYKSRKYSDEEIGIIKEFCKKNKKELVAIGNAQSWVENRENVEPLEMLTYIKGADFIITDTFHGTVFSIKYNKPFATLVRPDNINKLKDLLIRLKKEDRIISDFYELDKIYHCPIDFTETNNIIEQEKKHTYQYLKNATKVI